MYLNGSNLKGIKGYTPTTRWTHCSASYFLLVTKYSSGIILDHSTDSLVISTISQYFYLLNVP